eukprot:CAMPEP_0181470234 /NCGR_PEP_ID=MMETSP1110-20121109/38444_1 /TAXON_ID=174948 /ORGANISM="Symbiodinium sp., Strain CCMP421" /LENGTH=589 /DNA_ID=CAMNT_0023595195 /DNA_START=88 /DNA_END=1858 /DNA_ORIENTATION=-
MGLLRFNKQASRALKAGQRRKFTFFSAVGLSLSLGLLFLAKDWAHHSSEKAGVPRRLNETEQEEPSSLYPPDLLLEEPFFEEPLGKKFLALFHVVGMAYMVIGLNTVCDVYFAGSIDLLCDAWSLTPDVAGATWMAAGGSAPELFTSLIGATIANNDIGFGTIVGSAVFNILFVIGLCGYVAKGNIDLTWWPLFRDCSYYIISLGLLAYFVSDQRVLAWEAAVLFALYIVYVLFMLVNRPVNVWAYQVTGTPLNKELREYVQEQRMASGKVEPENTKSQEAAAQKSDEPPKPAKDNFMEPDKVVIKGNPPDDEQEPEDLAKDKEKEAQPQAKEDGISNEDGDDDEDDDEPEDFMEKPEGVVNLIIWALCLPLYACIYFTLPWPSKGSKLYMVTFFLSLLWIGCFAFLLVWWTETVAAVIGVPTIISGLTFLAAATSIPDAVSSMAVARKGQADMAVSSSVGSNIFDILVGLPAGWLLKNAIESADPDWKGVPIRSPFLLFYTVLLLSMVFGTVVSIMLSGWKLNKLLGACMAVLYVLVIITCVLVEELKPEALMTNPELGEFGECQTSGPQAQGPRNSAEGIGGFDHRS